MDTLSEMQSWMGLTEADTERLRVVLPVIEPHIVSIINEFYERIDAHEGARRVMRDEAQIERLKGTLRVWIAEVFQGPHDQAYVERRQRIGEMHVRVGLQNRYIYLAMQGIQHRLTSLLLAELDDPGPAIASLDKVLMLDLALISGRFVREREALQLDALQTILVRHLRVSVFLVDADETIRAATEVSARMAGGDFGIGSYWWTAMPDGLVEACQLRAEAARCVEHQREITLPRVDVGESTPRSYRVHLVPLQHDDVTLLIQLEELTDAVEMEARLQRNEALAQLGALSAAVSHELRNPLAGISGALQVVSASMKPDAPHRDILRKVDSEVRRLNGLVSDLLAFARPLRSQPQVVDLGEVAAESVALVLADHPAATFPIEGSGTAFADPDLVKQILLNLLRNAVDASGTNAVVVIGLTNGRVCVTDDGAGVPQSLRKIIFKPFETTKTRGTGLGLAISKKNAAAMEGDLRLLPAEPGRGASFELSLRTS